MATKDEAGEANINSALSGKTNLSDMSEQQLAALGGESDEIDNEDFSEADFGNDFDPDATPAAKKEDSEPEEEEGEEEEEGSESEEEEGEEEEEGSESEEEEGEEEEEATPGKKPSKGDQRVPLKRFQEVNRRMRAIEADLEQARAELAAANSGTSNDEEAEYDFDAAEEEYQDLVLDGKKAEATAKRREIRAAEQSMFSKNAQETASNVTTSSRDKEVMDALAADYSELYPAMDIDHPDFNPDITLDVEAMLMGHIEQGMNRPAAFKRALDRAVKQYGLEPEEASEESEDNGKGKPTKKKTKKVIKKTKSKIKSGKGAPPNTTEAGSPGDAGGDTEEIDIDQLSDEELDALPESTLKRLRGD